MADDQRLICASAALSEGGNGVRFETADGPGFAIRYGGRVYAYRNRCAHVPMELDWNEGKFFDSEAKLLICSTHGAVYDPASGACRGGPCRGGGLAPIAVFERDGAVHLAGSALP